MSQSYNEEEDILSMEDIHAVIHTFSTLNHRKDSQILDNDQDQKDKDYLILNLKEKVMQQKQQFSLMIRSAIKVFDYFVNIQNDLKLKTQELEQIIEEKKESIIQRNQISQNYERKLKEFQKQMEKLKIQNAELQQKIQIQARQYRRERKQINKTFRIVRENTEVDKNTVENLQFQIENIMKELSQEIKQKQDIKEELNQFKLKYDEIELKLHSSEQKCEFEMKRKLKAEAGIVQKQKEVDQLQNQLKHYKNLFASKHEDIQEQEVDEVYDHMSEEKPQNIVLSKISYVEEKNKLSQEISQFKEESDELDLYRGSFVERNGLDQEKMETQESDERKDPILIEDRSRYRLHVNASMSSVPQSQNYGQPIIINVPDMYFAHYMLLSQSVKLKMAKQELMTIDVKPYYRDVINSGVPMHIWDDWILNKIKQIWKEERKK